MTSTGNTEQYEAWNGESGQRWVADADRRDRVLAPVADALLAVADPRPGERVLDLGCGCGVTTLAAARAVGPAGSVTGVDLSAPMLGLARERRDDDALSHVDFVQGDAQVHDVGGPYDLAMGRFGTMFFADPVAAFTNVGRALRPGARLCLATWQPLADNEWLIVPGTVLLRYGKLPAGAGDGPGMFAQSEPIRVTRVLRGAGFADIALEPITLDLCLGADPDEATDYLADSGVGRAVLDTVPDHDRPIALEAVRAALTDHTDATGVHLGAAIWLITAAR